MAVLNRAHTDFVQKPRDVQTRNFCRLVSGEKSKTHLYNYSFCLSPLLQKKWVENHFL